VIQLALKVGVHAQPAEAVTATAPEIPPKGALIDEGDNVYAQSIAASLSARISAGLNARRYSRTSSRVAAMPSEYGPPSVIAFTEAGTVPVTALLPTSVPLMYSRSASPS